MAVKGLKYRTSIIQAADKQQNALYIKQINGYITTESIHVSQMNID